ncbi:MAG: hypothetical protein KAU17_10500 [Spirochaetales bacterium]|nr:hypothetical protein [Spirochaetales bacterium]
MAEGLSRIVGKAGIGYIQMKFVLLPEPNITPTVLLSTPRTGGVQFLQLFAGGHGELPRKTFLLFCQPALSFLI